MKMKHIPLVYTPIGDLWALKLTPDVQRTVAAAKAVLENMAVRSYEKVPNGRE